MNPDKNVRPSSAPYARILFPKIVEDKELPHSYKKYRFANIYKLSPLYDGARSDGFITLTHLCPDYSS